MAKLSADQNLEVLEISDSHHQNKILSIILRLVFILVFLLLLLSAILIISKNTRDVWKFFGAFKIKYI